MEWFVPVGSVVMVLFAVGLILFPEELIRRLNAGTKPGSSRSVKGSPGLARSLGIIILALAVGAVVVAVWPV